MVRQPVRGLLRPVAAGGGWAVAGYGLLVRPWHLRWGATEDEVRRPLPGDDLVATPLVAATGFTVTDLAAGHHWVGLIDGELGRLSVVQVVESTGTHATRLVIRLRAGFAPRLRAWLFWLVFDGGDFLFMRKEMLGIKDRAEAGARRPDGGSAGWPD